MAASRGTVEVFESSTQKTNLWLKDIESELHLRDRHKAYACLRSVLHCLRDCLPVDETAKFAAQMPLLICGVFYDGWKPRRKPIRFTRAALYDRIRAELRNQPGLDPALAFGAVVRTLTRHLSEGELDGVREILPREVRAAWDHAELFDSQEAADVRATRAMSHRAAPLPPPASSEYPYWLG